MEPLVDEFKGNPGEILASIYAANFPWLENYILQNSGSHDDARDIFQESITAVWLNLQSGKFKGDHERLNAYVRQICKYKWISELRSRNRKKTTYTDEPPENIDANLLANIDQDLTQSTILSHCFSKLGEKCRNVLGLFYYKKKSMAEIATAMQNTEESIKTIKYRCMMQLRQFFLEEMKKDGAI